MHIGFAEGVRDELRRRVEEAARTAPAATELTVVELAGPVDLGAPGPRTLVVASSLSNLDLAALLSTAKLRHLVVPEVPLLELSATLQRMAGATADGCADLLGPTVARHAWQLSASDEREAVLQALRGQAIAAGLSQRVTERLVTIADELVTNALYDAPVDAEGRPLHAHRSRTERVVLAPGLPVEVRFAADEERAAVLVRDGFGSLTEQVLVDNLVRCLRAGPDQVDGKPGGAGLGLFTVLLASNHLLVTRGPAFTEFIAIVDRRVSRPAGRCFNWFEVG